MKHFDEWPFPAMATEAGRPNILVVGNSGSGKTSLIHAVLGDGDAVETDATGEFCRFENAAIRLWDSRGLRLGESENAFRKRMSEFIDDCRIDPDVREHIHLLWYLIPGSGARVTDCDLKLMRSILSCDQVIAVISKSDITRSGSGRRHSKNAAGSRYSGRADCGGLRPSGRFGRMPEIG